MGGSEDDVGLPKRKMTRVAFLHGKGGLLSSLLFVVFKTNRVGLRGRLFL